jgi:hypothetical protein
MDQTAELIQMLDTVSLPGMQTTASPATMQTLITQYINVIMRVLEKCDSPGSSFDFNAVNRRIMNLASPELPWIAGLMHVVTKAKAGIYSRITNPSLEKREIEDIARHTTSMSLLLRGCQKNIRDTGRTIPPKDQSTFAALCASIDAISCFTTPPIAITEAKATDSPAIQTAKKMIESCLFSAPFALCFPEGAINASLIGVASQELLMCLDNISAHIALSNPKQHAVVKYVDSVHSLIRQLLFYRSGSQ